MNFGGKNVNERDHLDATDADGIIILKRISLKWDCRAWNGLTL
jgi:hypothetical protein